MSRNNKSIKHNGPKYTRYFYAYSDRMIVDGLGGMELFTNEGVTGDWGESLTLKNHIVEFELDMTNGDVSGKYGVLNIPDNYIIEFLNNGPRHKEYKLCPRVLDTTEKNLVYLMNFDPKHSCVNFMDCGETPFIDAKPIPYRRFVGDKSVVELMNESGYNLKQTIPYIGFLTKHKKVVHGIEQKLNINIYSIPNTLENNELNLLFHRQ